MLSNDKSLNPVDTDAGATPAPPDDGTGGAGVTKAGIVDTDGNFWMWVLIIAGVAWMIWYFNQGN